MFFLSAHEVTISWSKSFVSLGNENFNSLLILLFGFIVCLRLNYKFWFTDLPSSRGFKLVFKFFKSTLRNGSLVWNQPYLFVSILIFTWFYLTNLFSSIPFIISLTAVLPVIFLCVLLTFGSANIVGIYYNRLNFFEIFLPAGSPKITSILLVPIETIAYFAKFLSITVRLFANTLAGYILIEMFFSFFLNLSSSLPYNYFLSFGLGLMIFFLAVLKTAISLLQSFIFSLLTSFYISDPLTLH